MKVSIKKIDQTNWEECIELSVGPTQLGLIGTNIRSLAELSVTPFGTAFGIYNNEVMVGFAALIKDEKTQIYDIHRFMIDFKHQSSGIGRQALKLIIEHVKNLSDRSDKISVAFLLENLAAENFYSQMKFVDSGQRIKNDRWKFIEKLFYYYFE